MGTKGDLAKAFATLISVLWNEQYTFLSPVTFRVRHACIISERVLIFACAAMQKSISTYAPSFAGTDQHDSQEFLSFLLDGLHEDLNRIRTKPPPVEMTPDREAALETLPPSVAAEKEWQIYKQRNDSLIVDLFQGQYRNRMECLTCHKVCPSNLGCTVNANLSMPARHRRRTMHSCTYPCLCHRGNRRLSSTS